MWNLKRNYINGLNKTETLRLKEQTYGFWEKDVGRG